jgi:uncharacterized protein YuzE
VWYMIFRINLVLQSSGNNMHTTYSLDCGAVYIKLTEKRISYTDDLNSHINVDYDEDDRIVGIELTGRTNKESFNKSSIEFLGLDKSKVLGAAKACGDRSQYEGILEDFIAEKGLQGEFNAWLDKHYLSALREEP